MGGPKITNVDQWLSNVLPPDGSLDDQPDVLTTIEPVHPVESAPLEEVSMDVPEYVDTYPTAGSLQRSARKFGKPKGDKITRASKVLKQYLAKNADYNENYYIFVAEEVLRKPSILPFVNPGFAKIILRGIAELRDFKMFPYYDLNKENRDYKCIVTIPSYAVAFINGTAAERNMVNALIWHEIVGHCHDHRPGSDFVENASRSMEKLYKDAPTYMVAAEAVLEFSSHVRQFDFMVTKQGFPKRKNVVPEYFANRSQMRFLEHALKTLEILNHERKMGKSGVATFVKKRIASVSKKTRRYLWNLLYNEYNLKASVLKQLGLTPA